jgi:electron transfer flavoprotein alpha subunit
MKLKKVLVFSDLASARPGLCSGGNLLAEETVAVVLGTRAEAEALEGYASEVLWLGEKAEGFMVEDYVPVLADMIKAARPELVLISSTRRGKCVSGRLSARLGAGVVADVSAVALTEDGGILMKRSVYGGAAIAAVKPAGDLTIALAGSGAFEDTRTGAALKITEVAAAPVRGGVACISVAAKQVENVDLGAAKKVVGIGRGIGARENIAVLAELAAKLGAELACTRPIAEEEHWMSRSRYVGVSGVVIKPDVYIACGISGQVQHMVGVSDANVIIAINNDSKAPIFQSCDYGLVGDINKIAPELLKQL